ncbi:hypothetical protein LCGC14_0345120 [marine sediment metagenome]|uniref:Uncharacterized protein n=1 Tax=marine sediment metagenome TaxID=412755 RepID=A0A0F9VZR2_9ZZZZ|nr:hypothetical protein [Maribacter sp.]HDZ04733.1 hypothetical protein [Maribacter sp.]HEC37083.1 hypothetical protein [bacterium]
MLYQDVFLIFWKLVIESIEEGNFAKLTMAKTIGKPNLRNIFVRPIYSEDGFKVLLKLRYRSRETEDQTEELTLDEAFIILKSHLKTSFSTVLLFTTTKDVLFKVNKKGVGSFTENPPTFSDITQAKIDD